MNEQWKDISGYEGLYQISDKGNIRRTSKKGLRKLINHSRGYLTIQLHKGNQRERFYVHRLVASAFLGMPSVGLTQCHHKNCIPTDNRVENLEWVNVQYNNHPSNRKQFATIEYMI